MAQLTVKGKIKRIFWEGKGVEIVENISTKTGVFEKRYTAWFESPVPFREGDQGTITGQLSAKIELWADKEGNPTIDKKTGLQGQSVKLEINGATFTSDTPDYVTTKTPDAIPF